MESDSGAVSPRGAAVKMLLQETNEEHVNVSVLLRAMSACVMDYNIADNQEFYSRVAEEYGHLFPEHEDVSICAIEKYELKARAIAKAFANGGDPLTDTSQEFTRELPQIVAFYKRVSTDTLDDPSTVEPLRSSPTAETATEAMPPPLHQDNELHSSHGGSEDGDLDDTKASIDTAVPSDQVKVKAEQITVASAPAAFDETPFNIHFDPLNPLEAIETIRRLTEARAEAERRCLAKEALVKAERLRVKQAKEECENLEAIVKEYRKRNKERMRIERLMEGTSTTEGAASLDEDRKAMRKEQKRLKRQQETIGMQYKLLESENLRFKMTIEKEMTDLRREYTDASVHAVFPDITLQ